LRLCEDAPDALLAADRCLQRKAPIYFTLEGALIRGRVNPNAGARDGGPLRLAVDLNNMHLLNEATGVVI
jgi:multiple sugar transport system ATP-binding protein